MQSNSAVQPINDEQNVKIQTPQQNLLLRNLEEVTFQNDKFSITPSNQTKNQASKLESFDILKPLPILPVHKGKEPLDLKKTKNNFTEKIGTELLTNPINPKVKYFQNCIEGTHLFKNFICAKCGDKQILKVNHLIANELYNQNEKFSQKKIVFENHFDNSIKLIEQTQLLKNYKLVYELLSPKNNQVLKEQVSYVLNKSLKGCKYQNIGIHQEVDVNQISTELRRNIQYINSQFDTNRPNFDRNLGFDSLIECGNLERVYQQPGKQNYILFMRGEYNPIKSNHMQWFYFHACNMNANVEYTFTLMPLTKYIQFFNAGQQIWAKFGAKSKWAHCGYDYEIIEIPNNEDKPLFKLIFKIKAPTDLSINDRVEISFSRPISYTKIINQIINLENKTLNNQETKSSLHFKFKMENQGIKYTRDILGYTPLGIPIQVIKITEQNNKQTYQQKRTILVVSRTHSGETPTSLIFLKILQTLLSNDNLIVSLRQKYEFILIPCMCPDGVVLGNSRVNSLGYDLNRQWEKPDFDLHPEIFQLKKLMNIINYNSNQNAHGGPFSMLISKIQIFCDIHCHSKKLSSFFYGCNTAAKGGITSWTKTRLFPRIIAKRNPRISIKKCEFSITSDKLGTGRVVAWDQFGITNSFTFENSFFGYRDIEGQIQMYKKEDYQELGQDFIFSLHEFQKIVKQLEKDLVQSNGWLRPHKLLEMTGESALEQAQKEAIKQKLLQERQINIEQYREIMKNEDYQQMIQALLEAKKNKKKKQDPGLKQIQSNNLSGQMSRKSTNRV